MAHRIRFNEALTAGARQPALSQHVLRPWAARPIVRVVSIALERVYIKPRR